MATDADAVSAHYGHRGLLETILDGVRAAGADPGALTPEILAPVDEFHTAGRATTTRLFSRLRLAPGMHVLDVGCGIGGAARCLAVEHGCEVTGIDLTPEFVDTARALAACMGVDARCRFERGDALALPYPDAAFDVAVSFHAVMNIRAREPFYTGIARVLRRGAQLGVFDVMKGPTPGMRFPVPWAETPAISHLESPQRTREHLAGAGFTLVAEENLRDFAIAYFEKVLADNADGAPPPLGLHLLVGDNAAAKFANYLASLKDHQIEPVMLVAERD